MNKQELKLVGAIIYVCEGTKKRRDPRGKNRYTYSIEVTNSNPKIIALFLRFLREIIHIDERRLRGQLFVYPDHEKDKLINYWSKISGISREQFQKVITLNQKNKRYKPNPLGTFKIRYSSKKDFLRLDKIISEVWKGAGVD